MRARLEALEKRAVSAPTEKLTRFAPGLVMLRGYRREWFRADLLAGITGCVVMIPSVIAYAGLIGLPAQYGLYAALVPLLVYPFFGSSPQVIVGPDIAISLLIAGAVGPLAGGDSSRALALTCTLAVLTGVLLLLGARAKMGSVANFLSKPVLVGYMTGAALILVASQLNKLFGITLKNNDFFQRLAELAGKLNQTHEPTLIFGLVLLLLLVGLRHFAPKIPYSLVICAVAIVASVTLGLEHRGVLVVGQIPRGLPAFALPYSNWRDLHTLFPAAIGIALLTYTEGILLARAFAAQNGYEVDSNQELAALGVAGIFNGFFQGFSGTGSQSRTAINDAAGGKTQVASLLMAGALAIFLLCLTPLIARIPVVALAVILIYGGYTLVEFSVMKRIYRYYPQAAAMAAITTFAVLAAGVALGILIGVVLSLLGLVNRLSHPPDAILREMPGQGFHDLGAVDGGQTIPGLVIYRFYAPLVFSNVAHFVQRIREIIAASPTPVRWFLLDAQAITDIDVTAIETIHAFRAELQQRGIALKIAHANRPFRDMLERTGLAREIDEKNFFSSVHECVQAFEHQP
jgi:SulP family sulfate permease